MQHRKTKQTPATIAPKPAILKLYAIYGDLAGRRIAVPARKPDGTLKKYRDIDRAIQWELGRFTSKVNKQWVFASGRNKAEALELVRDITWGRPKSGLSASAAIASTAFQGLTAG